LLALSAVVALIAVGLHVPPRWPSVRVALARPACGDSAAEPMGRVARLMQAMSREQRVGQLLMLGRASGASDADVAALDDAIRRLHAGNVVLYGSGWNGAAMLRSVLRPLQQEAQDANAGVRLFVSGNQEGGQAGAFQAFYGSGFEAMPSAYAQAQADPAKLEELARNWGTELVNAGINLNLAPVLDTVPPGNLAANDPIGHWNREYGTDPGTVTAYGVAVARGMLRAGDGHSLAVSLKHFPGLGRVTGNTDFTAQGIEDDFFSGLDDPYLAPFQAGIDAGAQFVMVSSAIYPRVDTQRAMFSPTIVTDILRNGMGFNGVIITDDVGDAAAVADLTPGQRAVRFLRAGGDMVLTVEPSDAAPMQQAILAEMDADPAFAAAVDASVQRVLAAKAARGLLPDPLTTC
jgi:beta-N-acetylhexosaminidase